jgi:hypothetical protein
LRTRAKAFKALAENEEWLSGEKAPLLAIPPHFTKQVEARKMVAWFAADRAGGG